MSSKMMRYMAEGLCPYCGGDKGDHYSCKKCRDIRNAKLKKRRDDRRANGICPRCGKEKLWGDERQCLECSAKDYAISQKRDREHFNQVHREWERRKNAQMREQGICYRCRKRPASFGYKSCSICRARSNKYYQENYAHPRPLTKCRWCDNPPLEGMRVCEFHLQEQIRRANSENAKKMRKVTKNLW